MPIFGETSGGGFSVAAQLANVLFASRYTLTEAGDVSKLTAKIQGDGAVTSQAIRGAIYANSGGVPGTRLGVSNEVVVDTTVTAATATDLTFGTPIGLVAADYFLCVFFGPQVGAGFAQICYVLGTTDQFQLKDPATYPTGPDPFGTPTWQTSWSLHVYATYTATQARPFINTTVAI